MVAELGSQIWTREHVFELGGVWYRQQERFFLVRVEEFDARFNSLDEGEAEYLKGLRWWSPDELDAADERLVPGDLAALVRATDRVRASSRAHRSWRVERTAVRRGESLAGVSAE